MADENRFLAKLSGPARRDIAAILRKSRADFGEAAARRYAELVSQGLRDLERDPERHGSKQLGAGVAPGLRVYSLEFSRTHVAGKRVQSPRHLILYRVGGDGSLESGRVLHDGQKLELHIPKPLRRTPD